MGMRMTKRFSRWMPVVLMLTGAIAPWPGSPGWSARSWAAPEGAATPLPVAPSPVPPPAETAPAVPEAAPLEILPWVDGQGASGDVPVPQLPPGETEPTTLPPGTGFLEFPSAPGGDPLVPWQDPAEQIEPALIELDDRNKPISPVVALTMRQELNNLIGRFESALLMADSSGLPTEVTLAGAAPILTASTNPQPPTGEDTSLHPALAEARQLLEEWNDLMARREYGEARDRWQSVRQTLWDNFPTERPLAQAEIRAVWLDRATIVAAKSPEGLAAVFDRLAVAGVNTVFLETVNAGYPIYPSKVAPYRNPLIRRWDPLKAAVELGHARGMEVHAWIWTFAVGNQVHNTLLDLPLDYPGPLLILHPSWAGVDHLGNAIPQGQAKPFLDPANLEVRSYLLRLISEIITQYDVDGLQLDYIRYPFQDPGAGRTYGYGTAARWRFRGMTGVDPLELATPLTVQATAAERRRRSQLWDRWTEFRIQQINTFVEEVSLMVRRQRPDLVLSAAVFAKPEAERLQRIQQDWGTWARKGYVDWIVLMSYAEDTNRFEELIRPWLVNQDFRNALIIPSIRLLNLSEPAAIDQILASRDLPAPGYALFAATDLNQELETILSRTQGGVTTPPQLSHQAAAFAMAHARYQALQREWNLLLGRRQLWMEQPVLIQWIEDVNALGQALQALAEDPTARRIQTVETGLAAVRDPLSNRVLVDTANGSYRLQTWQHRLTVIDRLISYGEQAKP